MARAIHEQKESLAEAILRMDSDLLLYLPLESSNALLVTE